MSHCKIGWSVNNSPYFPSMSSFLLLSSHGRTWKRRHDQSQRQGRGLGGGTEIKYTFQYHCCNEYWRRCEKEKSIVTTSGNAWVCQEGRSDSVVTGKRGVQMFWIIDTRSIPTHVLWINPVGGLKEGEDFGPKYLWGVAQYTHFKPITHLTRGHVSCDGMWNVQISGWNVLITLIPWSQNESPRRQPTLDLKGKERWWGRDQLRVCLDLRENEVHVSIRIQSRDLGVWNNQKWSRELKTRPIYECRCDERLKTKDEKSTRISYTGLGSSGNWNT